ncbi:MAG: Eco57I restriction-modification methylase domain-containing protein [Bacteroidales bacterium]|nr:Eco57I restriction-modification methylase domain-containing protein [Bacteroidales bacterium]
MILTKHPTDQATGDVFTSPGLVCALLDDLGYRASEDLRSVSVLEPACGTGAFLLEILHRLRLSARHFGFSFKTAVARNVRACEIDADKVGCLQQSVRHQFPELDGGVNVHLGDFLQYHPAQKFRIIVGNPPYIRYDKLSDDVKAFCRRQFRTFCGRCDLYVVFYEHCLEMLSADGRLGLVTPDRWLRNQYGSRLRQYIAQSFRLEKLVFLSHDVFHTKVLAYPCYSVVGGCQTQSRGTLLRESDGRERMCVHPSTSDWSSLFWPSSAHQMYTLAELGFDVHIGIATGADHIYINKELAQQVESERLLPLLKAAHLRNDMLQWDGTYLLNVFLQDGTVAPLDNFPRMAAYLQQNEPILKKRYVARRNPCYWYRTIDAVSIRLLQQPKILLPDLSASRRIWVDEGRFYPGHNLYVITGGSIRLLKVLSVLLMSDLVQKQMERLSNQMNGGFTRWQTQYLRKLTLPDIRLLSEKQQQRALELYEHPDYRSIDSFAKEAFPLNPARQFIPTS